MKIKDFIGEWVVFKDKTPSLEDSYAFVTSIIKHKGHYQVNFRQSFINKHYVSNHWRDVFGLEELKIVSEKEVAKKAIEYGHDLKELGLEQYSIKKILKKEDLYNTKIWIGKNEELSRKVQERLFELGFEWRSSYKKIFKQHVTALYLNERNFLGYTIGETKDFYFNDYHFKEITLSDLGLDLESINKSIVNQTEQFGIQIIPVIQEKNIIIPEIKLNKLNLKL